MARYSQRYTVGMSVKDNSKKEVNGTSVQADEAD
jgi:hypothetical protein